MPTTLTVIRHAEVRAVLADARFAVPPVPTDDATGGAAGAAGGIGWLRAHVARFSTGAIHHRRRAQAIAELDRMSPAALRRQAGQWAAAVMSGAGGRPVDLMAEVARTVPVGVLAGALGLSVPVSPEVAVVAEGYHPGTDAGPAADAAVAYLVEAFGGTPDEATAARIGLLVQACDATAGLIGNAVLAPPRDRLAAPVEAVLAETLRHDPPVRVIRRVSAMPARAGNTDLATGTPVQLDLATANRDPHVFRDPDRFDPARPWKQRHLTFGAGLRPCPGSDHALAIAAGVVEAVRGCRIVDAEVNPDPAARSRVPARLIVSQR